MVAQIKSRRPRADVLEEQWSRHYQRLVAFHAEHGHCRINQTAAAKLSSGLPKWIARQRLRKLNGTLDPVHQAKLEALGFPWEAPRRTIIQEVIAAVRAYQAEHGTPNIPLSCYQNRDPRYGIAAMRLNRFRHGQGLALVDAEQYAELLALGVDMAPPGRRDHGKWQRHFARYCAFVARGGDILMTDDEALRNWVSHQKFDALNGRMAPKRRALLESVGFDFDISLRTSKSESAYRDYAKMSLMERVDLTITTNDRLRDWVSKQRLEYARGLLSPERQAALEAIGFHWTLESLKIAAFRALAAAYFRKPGTPQLRIADELRLAQLLTSDLEKPRRSDSDRKLRLYRKLRELVPVEAVSDSEVQIDPGHLVLQQLPRPLYTWLRLGGFRCVAELSEMPLETLAERLEVSLIRLRRYRDVLGRLGVLCELPKDPVFSPMPLPEAPAAELDAPRNWLALGFSVRLSNRLARAGIRTVRELLNCDPASLMRINGFGRKCKQEMLEQQARLLGSPLPGDVFGVEAAVDASVREALASEPSSGTELDARRDWRAWRALGFSRRLAHCLLRADIRTLRAALALEPASLRHIDGFGLITEREFTEHQTRLRACMPQA